MAIDAASHVLRRQPVPLTLLDDVPVMASQARRAPLCGQRGRRCLCGQLGRQRILLVDGRVCAARAVVVGGAAAGCLPAGPAGGPHGAGRRGAAEVTDVVARMGQDFPRTALFILITTYLVLFLLLRSVVLPLKALIMNSLSIIASFGALVWIFQDGNLSALLGFQPLGYVETTQPVILFCVLFGLSMDYEVFLLSRMKEAYDAGADNRTAVARGLERSGRIVTSAALIVVIVAGSFVFAQVVLIKALGLGMAIAVALDATVVRALLVPATMRLLGHWNWWMPARLARWIAARLPVVEGATLVQAVVVAILAAFVLGACSANGALLANAPAAHPRSRVRAPPGRPARPAAAGLPARRRAARPPHRVVVLHGPPADRRPARRTGSRTSSSAPNGAPSR